VFLSASTQAGTFIVNIPSDVVDAIPGDGICDASPPNHVCTLRAAIQETNALPGSDTIILPPNTHPLSQVSELTITDHLTITGGGASTTIIDGNKNARPNSGVLVINAGVTVNLSGVTIRNGGRLSAASGGGIRNMGTTTLTNSTVSGNSASNAGGGIYNSGGTLTLTNSTVSGNNAGVGGGRGGGIADDGGTMTLTNSTVSGNSSGFRGGGIDSFGTWTLTNSTVTGNSASASGGIFNRGTLTVTNSTVTGNSATGASGVPGVAGGIGNFGTMTLTNSTVSGNRANEEGGGINNNNSITGAAIASLFNSTITNNQADVDFNGSGTGGGVFNEAGATFIFQNTIIAGNSETLRVGNFFVATTGECDGLITSGGNNLMENYNTGHCTVSGIPPILTDPKLGPLQDNGGPTQTHALLAGSPAIDGGNPGGCRDNLGVLLPTDQRGFPRSVDGNNDSVVRCDIGAYELFSGSNTSVVAALLPSSRSVQVGAPATAFATVINTGQGTAAACSIAPLTNVPAVFQYQTTDSDTNQVIGFPNTAASIAAGASQSFVFAVTATAPIAPTDVQFSFDCANSDPAPINSGLNTLLLSASNTPVPDIVALAAANDGIVDIPGTNGTGVFAVATVNVGASAGITASADTGTAVLPVNVFLCETNPANGQCISGIGPSVSTTINANATPTFGIFVQGNGNVPFDPAGNRIFVRFKDGGGVTRGSTSVAVRTQ
jgi:hypothetical protein